MTNRNHCFTATYGALTMRVMPAAFFDEVGYTVFLERDSEVIFMAHYTPEGVLEDVWKNRGRVKYDSLTRAKGFRYWEKYFPGTYDFQLPELLQEATEMPPRSCGVFRNKRGELCGYEG